MQRLSSIIWLVVLCNALYAQSPHGSDFKINCGDCHTTDGWKVNLKTFSFNHDLTQFALVGQHKQISCRSCHKSLIFSEAETDCMSCHTDIHYQTVGFECSRCHTPKSWIVENITEIHQLSRFPLVGAHVTADCYTCHPSESLLRFEPLGVECYDCHQDDYQTTTNPSHVDGNFSTDCSECHFITSFTWTGTDFNHSFFPLTEGHAVNDCNKCHIPGSDYSNISAECVSCHQTDYNTTSNPNHAGADFSTDCAECHTTKPGWKPADFDQHDALFPIYSGSHNGEWNTCAECHTTAGNYGLFSCIDCHEHNQGDTDDEHDEVSGYTWSSMACFECHPTGDAEGSFNHSTSNFPLTGAHITAECSGCHLNGYSGTPTICFACHENDFNQSANPNHNSIGIPNDCETCHTTNPGWQPATFPIHINYYPLTGAHSSIENECFICHEGDYNNTPNVCAGCHMNNYNQSTNPDHNAIGIPTDCETCHTTVPDWQPAAFPIHNQYWPLTGAHVYVDCYSCHTGNYNSTPNTCVGCHLDDYNQTTDPNHTAAQFPTDCELCHTKAAWVPSTFDHDGLYFPIYSGSHEGEWNSCSECHPNPSNYSIFTCLTCHEQSETDGEHEDVSGYSYNSDACLACHPDGEAEEKKFRLNNSIPE